MLDVLFVILSQAAAGPPAGPAPEQTPAAQEAPAAAAATAQTDDRNRRRCRTQTMTGSRLGTRVCLSPAEEDAMSNEARRLLENGMRMWDNQSSPGGSGSAGGG